MQTWPPRRERPRRLCALIRLGFHFVPLFLAPAAAHAQAPRLELSSSPQGQTVQLLLSGDTSRTYVIEISTNLTVWQTQSQVQTTNGTAKLLYDPKQSRYSFLRARAEQPTLALTPQIAPAFGVSALVSSAGGELKIVTPDFRSITLSIPAACLNNPVEVRMSLVTNLVGLPFVQGTFGAVQIEPESLVLLGAAELSIEYPPDLDWHSVVSFAAGNDGTGWSVTADRALSNRVVIPVSDFGLYGSASTTLAELQAVIGPAARLFHVSQLSVHASEAPSDTNHDKYCLRTQAPELLKGCRQNNPQLLNVNLSQFNQSSLECFMPLVDRALAVQRELREFLTCGIMADLGNMLSLERQKQQLVGGTNGVDLAEAVSCICPIYQQKIAPLWEEAKGNCPLSIVLLQFMLGFERQVQTLDLARVVNCNYTLFSNIDKLCKSAEGCLQQIQGCCDDGKKGQEKYLEILHIVDQFDSIGDTKCFPAKMDDPRVQLALDACLTNAWYGNIAIRQYANSVTNVTQASRNDTYSLTVDKKFDGQVFSSDETRDAEGRTVLMIISGTGTSRQEQIAIQHSTSPCFGTNTSIFDYQSDRLTTGSLTLNGGESIQKQFLLQLDIPRDNKTYSLAGGPPVITGLQVERSLRSTTSCEGKTVSTPDGSNTDTRIDLPGISAENIAMGSDTNVLSGSRTNIEEWGFFPVVTMKTEMTWNLRRARQR